jgi:cell division protein FtsQ
MMKKLLIILVWIILIAGLGVVLGFAEKEHQSTLCGKCDIFIKYNSDDYFLTVDDVNNYFAGKGIKIKGAPLSDINTGDIEAAVYSIPYVEKVDASMTISGDVEIDIIQKRPIVKVYNKYGKDFYIDDKGGLMPSSDNYTARLLIANGYIGDYYNPYTSLNVTDSLGKDTLVMQTAIYKIYRMAQYISNDTFWKAMIEELFINDKGDIEMFTKIGEQSVIFGDIDNMDEKFDNLLIFYKQGLNKVGWSKYKTINLKYKNQVVCSKI